MRTALVALLVALLGAPLLAATAHAEIVRLEIRSRETAAGGAAPATIASESAITVFIGPSPFFDVTYRMPEWQPL